MNLKSFIKSLSIMHLFLVAGLSIFTAWSVYQIQSFESDLNGNNLFLKLVPILALAGYFGSQFLFKKMTTKIDINSALPEKLQKYKAALHLKYALIELPAFVGIFAYYTSGNALPLVISICLLVYLFVQKPTKDTILNSVPLKQEEKRTLQEL